MDPPSAVAQSVASSVPQSVASPVAQSVATTDTPRDSGFPAPTQTLIQEVAALTQAAALSQAERLARAEQARGGLVKIWREKARDPGQRPRLSRHHL